MDDFKFTGPEIDDPETLAAVPDELRGILEQVNGFIAYDGGLHIRGACREPLWHSLRHAWRGEQAFHQLYAAVTPEDVPFAQDSLGDQWLLRDGRVVRLRGETGDIEPLEKGLPDFLAWVDSDPLETLGMHPLLKFQSDGGRLEPGQLINVYPPFCFKESADGVRMRAVPALEQIDFLANLARQLPPDGAPVEFKIV